MLDIAAIFGGRPIGTALSNPARSAVDVRGTAAPHIEKHVPAEIEDADFAEIGAGFGEETDPEDDLADDLDGDLDGDLEGDTDSDAAVGDPELRYLAPLAAAKWLRTQGLDMDLAGLRRLVADGRGPPVAHFSGRLGGWRVRFDQLEQWADWQRFQASWSARARIVA